MIGVAAHPAQDDFVNEFFELFKTPWEWLVPGKRYRVVLSANGHTEPCDAELALVYGAAEHPIDRRVGVSAQASSGPVDVQWGESIVPVYGSFVTFHGQISDSLLSAHGVAADYRTTIGAMTLQRIGYDLFSEVAHLLSEGQPASHALIPTLERHIALIRHWLDESTIAYVEVPPRPQGADFVCCLTHDVDFFGIRRHLADRTLVGFALRGTLGTLRDLVRGRRPLDEALRNWLAVCSLPLVLLGISRDLWDPFRDYADADRGHKSTFFLVPFNNRSGVTPDGTINARRAVAYGIQDVKEQVQNIESQQTELAVHGIDAWRDAEAGREEMAQLTDVTAQPRTGVRTHWLYLSGESGRHLEDAGFDYDATWGYNDAVGFRAGTLQVFRLRGTENLLELPLSIMDTAMFYPDRMGLARDEAGERCTAIVQEARRFGGALVINWHDRSLAPERLWGRCYHSLVNEVENSGAWFAKAGEAVKWFRWRRSIRFAVDANSEHVTIDGPKVPDGLPAARVVVRGRPHLEESSFVGGTCSLTL
jgi:hypothetical protein